jgi:hypothetical protein
VQTIIRDAVQRTTDARFQYRRNQMNPLAFYILTTFSIPQIKNALLNVTARWSARDEAIDEFNARSTDGRIHYGSKYFRNGKRFHIKDSSNSPFRAYNRERILDLFDALHRDPETSHIP